MKKKKTAIACLGLALSVLTACSARKEAPAPTAAPTPAVTADAFLSATAAPAAPTPAATATPNIYPTVPPTPVPTVYATVPPTPPPTFQPAADPRQGVTTQMVSLPRITKNPGDETVYAGGWCQFVTRYENADLAEWHFVSRDGSLDATYKDVQNRFPTMNIIGGNTKDMTLEGIPEALNGCRVYCRFSNYAGSVDTATALLTVLPAQTPVSTRQGFVGRWAEEIAGRCQVEIRYLSEGSVNVDIRWSGSAWELARWQMTANVYRNDILVYDDAHYWVESYLNDTTFNITQESFGGTGSFYLQDGKLHWHDNQTGQDTVLVPA